MTKDKALDLALEALKNVTVTGPDDDGLVWINLPGNGTTGKAILRVGKAGLIAAQCAKLYEEQRTKAITAIKQALALDKKADNARELGLDYEPSAKVRDFWEGYVPEPVKPSPVQPVAFEVGLVEWVGNKLMATPKVTTTPPASWVEMVTANLVREGVNKHKARELAEHFYSLKEKP